MTRRIGIRELREQASTYIRRAGAGQRLLVTVSGAPVALLGPITSDPRSTLTIADLVAHGAVIAPRRNGKFKPGEAVAVHSGARIDQLLRQVRG